MKDLIILLQVTRSDYRFYPGEAGGIEGRMSSTSEIDQLIFGLLSNRAAGKTICPSEVARAMSKVEAEWRALMDPVRQRANELADEGRLQVTQHGEVVDGRRARGPIRLRLPPD
ncbi:hypothetical protein RvY_13777-2 [Ramazzottius varieornatus]|nr:hypothetical protein RvY_13777-2 [Ramazzottius varieornatus]